MPLSPGTPLAAIEALPLAAAMRDSPWLYPAVEIVHTLGFVLLAGSVAMLDLRVLGLSRAIPVTALARHILPWTLGALLLIVPSGLLMFISHIGDFIANPAFIAKMTLLSLAACNALWFHMGPYQGVDNWQTGAGAPLAAKASAALSLLLWMSIICCGRLLAYA
jgi:hypothetical protein